LLLLLLPGVCIWWVAETGERQREKLKNNLLLFFELREFSAAFWKDHSFLFSPSVLFQEKTLHIAHYYIAQFAVPPMPLE